MTTSVHATTRARSMPATPVRRCVFTLVASLRDRDWTAPATAPDGTFLSGPFECESNSSCAQAARNCLQGRFKICV